MTLCPASRCARELSEPQISTRQAVIFSLQYQREPKLNVVYLKVQGWRRQWFGSELVCWSVWGAAAPSGRAVSGERKYINSGSLIRCQLHVILYHSPGSFNRKRGGVLHIDFHCVSSLRIKTSFCSFLQRRVEGFQLAVVREHLNHIIYCKSCCMSIHLRIQSRALWISCTPD